MARLAFLAGLDNYQNIVCQQAVRDLLLSFVLIMLACFTILSMMLMHCRQYEVSLANQLLLESELLISSNTTS